MVQLSLLSLLIKGFGGLRVRGHRRGQKKGSGKEECRENPEREKRRVLAASHAAFVCVLYTIESEASAGVHACPCAAGEDAACAGVTFQAVALG
jgi:hypothetical protein